MTDIVERLRRDAARFAALEAAGDQPWVADAAWAADDLNAAADEIERLRAEVHKLSTTCGHCGDLERAWAEAAAARDEGGREALTGALHPEFGSIYAPNGAATVAHEAGRREGIEAAAKAVEGSASVTLRLCGPAAQSFHEDARYVDIRATYAAAIRALLTEGGR